MTVAIQVVSWAVVEPRRVSASGPDRWSADLSGADLTAADLHGRDLRYADLSGADMSGLDLTETNLTGARLVTTDLENANMTDANLAEADLSCALYEPKSGKPEIRGPTPAGLATAVGLREGLKAEVGWRIDDLTINRPAAFRPHLRESRDGRFDLISLHPFLPLPVVVSALKPWRDAAG